MRFEIRACLSKSLAASPSMPISFRCIVAVHVTRDIEILIHRTTWCELHPERKHLFDITIPVAPLKDLLTLNRTGWRRCSDRGPATGNT